MDRLPTISVDDVLSGQLDFHCPNECVSKTGFSAKNSRLFQKQRAFFKNFYLILLKKTPDNMSDMTKSQSKLYCWPLVFKVRGRSDPGLGHSGGNWVAAHLVRSHLGSG